MVGLTQLYAYERNGKTYRVYDLDDWNYLLEQAAYHLSEIRMVEQCGSGDERILVWSQKS